MATAHTGAERAAKIIAKTLQRRIPKWATPHSRPTDALRAATGIDVGADWRLPAGLNADDAETALKILVGNRIKRTELSQALVEAFATENPALFTQLSLRILTSNAAPPRLDPYYIAHGMLSGFPPACIADWVTIGNATHRSWAHRGRTAKVEERIGASIFWVASDETLTEILRIDEERRAMRRAARKKAKAAAAADLP